MMKKIFFFFTLVWFQQIVAQTNALYEYQFLSYGSIKTWTGLASNWQSTADTKIHLYDSNIYKGHADFASKGLKTGINFRQFKAAVKTANSRQYVPFFLYDFHQKPIVINGISYDWAVRLEDYSYTDSAEELAATVERLHTALESYLKENLQFRNQGILILAKSKTTKPNTLVVPHLSKKINHLTLSQLLQKTGGKSVQVLNEGVAYGYLKYISEAATTTTLLSHQDIPIFEKLPLKVPPVSGIITLQAQTPLSHVNLLSKNRGTVNLYTLDVKTLPNAHALMGKLVKLECSDKKITLTEATLPEAQRHWNKRKDLEINLPQPDLDLQRIVAFDLAADKQYQSTNIIGAKAANYAFIRQHFPDFVRKGFAIPFSYYFEYVKENGFQDKIDRFLHKREQLTLAQQKEEVASIRKQLRSGKLNPNLVKAIRSLMKKEYKGKRIRLRSSTNCEDLPQFNGAGLYTSKGFNDKDSEEKLRSKIQKVYASLWNWEAFLEREFYGIPHLDVGMAILINEAFVAEYANGVILTIPNKDKSSILLNTQIGENKVTNPESGQVPEAMLFENGKWTLQSQSNIQNIFENNAALKQQLQQIEMVIPKLDRLLKEKLQVEAPQYGTDLEFIIMKEEDSYQLFLKQARLLGGLE